MNLRRILSISILLCLPAHCRADEDLPERTAAVLNFSDTSVGPAQETYRWLSKGLTDMCINQLTQVPGLRLVTREHMQMLLEEADLVDSLMGKDALPRDSGEWLQKYLRVDDLLFGTYTIDEGTVRLQLNLIDQESGEVLGSFVEEGALDELLDLQERLVQRLAARMLGKEREEVEALELPRWSNSMEAAAHLYGGIDHFDAGRFTEAWYAFRQALEVDPNYADGRYWAARMSYYRQDYEHARLEFDRFILASPRHPRVGDAIMEYVHSFERLAESPEDILDVYRMLQASDWKDARVYHQFDYTSSSILADWLRKREQQVLRYQGKLHEAFQLLDSGFGDTEFNAADPYIRSWQSDASRLMRRLAELSEDGENLRLESPHAPYNDIVLPVENPTAQADLRSTKLHGDTYRWGENYRILAPPGYGMKKLTATVKRTNDPQCDAICRLQIRRYRYVDIHTCWSTNQEGKDRDYIYDVPLPPGCTWFYLRPEYAPNNPNLSQAGCSAAFDGWVVEAELEPLSDVGRIQLNIGNCTRFQAQVNGRYARCFNGVIGGLPAGTHRITITNMWDRQPWGFVPLQRDVKVVANRTVPLQLELSFSKEMHEQGWEDPQPVVTKYPWFKHRPRRQANRLGGQPCVIQNRRDPGYVISWSHLDDLWVTASSDGQSWGEQRNLAPPANSAHTEHNPSMIQDEQGRYCLLFQSDRGGLRNYASYVTWSRDLHHWVRPVMVSAISHKDHDLIQANNGEYIFIGTGERDGDKKGIQVRRSRDLLSWGEIETHSWYSDNTFICLRQDRRGRFYLIGVKEAYPYCAVSSDLADWSGFSWIYACTIRPDSTLSAAISGDRLVVGLGCKDGHYNGQALFEILSTPIRNARLAWRKVPEPQDVVGGLSDMMLDRETGKLVVVWQSMDDLLNSVYPSGPVFCMKGSLR
jgi:TolB-like protein